MSDEPADIAGCSFGDFRFDGTDRALYREDANGESSEITIAPRALAVLEYFLERPGQIVTKHELLDAVWNESFVGEDSLTRAVSLLRQALDDDSQHPEYIQTVPRRGYRFMAPVSVLGPGRGTEGRGSEPTLPGKAAREELSFKFTGAWKWATAFALVGLLSGIVISGLWVSRFGDASSLDEPHDGFQFSITLPEDEWVPLRSGPALTLSSDGRRLVYTGMSGGVRRLYLRVMTDIEAKPIAGTEGAYLPFFSPDGEWVGFFVREEGITKLKKVSLIDGQVLLVCDLGRGALGAIWGPDDTIVFAPSYSGLWQVSAEGGNPHALTTLDPSKHELAHHFPHFLPGGEAIVFGVYTGSGDRESRIAVLSLSTGKTKYLLEGGLFPRYSQSGHLVVALEGDLLAVPFDLGRLEVTGSPVVIIEGVATSQPATQFDLSATGTLVYVPSVGDADQSLVWIDRAGGADALPNLENFSRIRFPRVSPDGQHVALSLYRRGDESNIWVYDLARGSPSQLTFDGMSGIPVWSPDGKWLVFASAVRGISNLFLIPADGSSDPELLLESDKWQIPQDWSPDGKALLYQEWDNETLRDLWMLPLDGWSPGEDQPPEVSGSPVPFLRTPSAEAAGVFSPNGEWIAYWSLETGRREVYVRPSDDSGGKEKISVDGGIDPVWSPDGRKLYFAQTEIEDAVSLYGIYEVTLQFEPEFSASPPTKLFETPGGSRIALGVNSAGWDIAPDGERMLMVLGTEPDPHRQINVVLNWFEELKQRVLTGR